MKFKKGRILFGERAGLEVTRDTFGLGFEIWQSKIYTTLSIRFGFIRFSMLLGVRKLYDKVYL